MAERPDPATPTTTAAAAAVTQSRTESYLAPSAPAALAAGTPPSPQARAAALGFVIGRGVARGAQAAAYERLSGDPLYRPLWIYAVDPGAARGDGATAIINVPYEPLRDGPEGALFKVVSRDAGTGTRYKTLDPNAVDVLLQSGRAPSPADARFHQQMVYAVCSAVYAAFRRALGRQVAWGFERTSGDDPEGTHLLLFPHGGQRENAWYDPVEGSLRFGYYRAKDDVAGRNVPSGYVFTALSHDIVAHEVTHALLDGLRSHFMLPTSPDVLGFHEGFADVVAILQHFSYPEVVHTAIAASRGTLSQAELLVGLARQFGHTTGAKQALRTAVEVNDRGEVLPRLYRADAEQHEMGSVLVSAVFDAFLTVFKRKTARYVRLATDGTGVLPLGELPADLQTVLAERASKLASQFLSICIRAIDYCPPVDIELGEYLRALLTADYDLVPDDPWGYREAWIEAFSRHRIYPPQVRSLAEDELRWQPPDQVIDPDEELSFAKLQFRGDPGSAAGAAELERQAAAIGAIVVTHYTQFGMAKPGPRPEGDYLELPCVQSVRSCRRVGPDGQIVFDLVAEVTQRRVVAHPEGDFDVYGGATVLIGPNGEMRYVVAKNVLNARRTERQRQFVQGRGRVLWSVEKDDRWIPRRDLFELLHQKTSSR